MDLINLTRKERSGKAEASPLQVLVNLDKINRPINENIDADSVLYVEESITINRQDEGINSVQYVVEEDLDAINALSTRVFVANVLKRDDQKPVVGFSKLGFVSSRVIGSIIESGSGSQFYYHEDDGSYPVKYTVNETVAAIKLMLE